MPTFKPTCPVPPRPKTDGNGSEKSPGLAFLEHDPEDFSPRPPNPHMDDPIKGPLYELDMVGNSSSDDEDWDKVEDTKGVPCQDLLLSICSQERRPNPFLSFFRREDPALQFDDKDAVFVGDSDSEEERKMAGHDYEFAYKETTKPECYAFETNHPNAAPLLRYLFTMPGMHIGGSIHRVMRLRVKSAIEKFSGTVEDALLAGRLVLDMKEVDGSELATAVDGRVTDSGNVVYKGTDGKMIEVRFHEKK